MNSRMMKIAAGAVLLVALMLAGGARAKTEGLTPEQQAIYDKAMSGQKDGNYDLVIDTDTTWSGQMTVGRVLVTNQAVLTIEANTNVDFYRQDSDARLVVIGGHVRLEGEAGQMVILRSSAPAVNADQRWLGVLIYDDDEGYSTVSMDYSLVINSQLGVLASGSQCALAARDSYSVGGIWGFASYGGGFGSVQDCTVADCTAYGFDIQSPNFLISDCAAYRCVTGFRSRVTLTDCSANDCGLGFDFNYWEWVTIGRDCEAMSCDTGAKLTGRVSLDGFTAVGSRDIGILVETWDEYTASLNHVDVRDTELGPGLRAWVDEATEVKVYVSNSNFSNNAVNVEVDASDTSGNVCPLLLGRGDQAGQNNILHGTNTTWDVANYCTGTTMYAEYCYWGQEWPNPPSPSVRGYADITPYLVSGVNIHEDFAKSNATPEAELTAKAYPNPFNPSTTIAFALPGQSNQVRLDIVDVRGRLVKTLIDRTMSGRQGQVQWTGTDNSGGHVATGVYFYRLVVDGQLQNTGKLTLTK